MMDTIDDVHQTVLQKLIEYDAEWSESVTNIVVSTR